ncbi:MAG: hypothetical protein HKN36_09260 [Hellea sp.]|nr:hypothetical protein [Hellea sp.]
MKTLQELLGPLEGEDGPTGPDLDETKEFDALRSAFTGNFPYDAKVREPEEGAPPPKPADWDEILQSIEDLSEKTKDMYLAACYARCGIVIGDLEVVERGTQFLAGLVSDNWDEVHPTIDALGYQGRAGICEGIVAYNAFALPFLEMPILRTKNLSVTADQLRDALEHESASQHYPMVMDVVDQLGADKVESVVSTLSSIQAALSQIQDAMKEHGGSDCPDFSTPKDTIGIVKKSLISLAGIGVAEEEDEEAAAEGGAGAAAGGPSFSGKIRSRDDVVRALSEVENYYNQAEPGHPVRVALARMRAWVHKDFMQIIADIAPRSLDEARLVLLETEEDRD